MATKYTHGTDALHGEQDRGEEQRHVCGGRDPRTGPDVGQRDGVFGGKRTDAVDHPYDGAPQADQYARGGDGRERDEQPERTYAAERQQRQGQTQDPGADGKLPFRGRMLVGHL